MTGHVLDRLSPYLDRELPEADRLAVKSHLETCASCALALAQLGSVDDVARGLPVDAPPGYFEDFPARVRRRIERQAPRAFWRPWAWAAATAVLLAVTTPLLLQDGARLPAPVEPEAAGRSIGQLAPSPAAAPPTPADATTGRAARRPPAAPTSGAARGERDERAGVTDAAALLRRDQAAETEAPAKAAESARQEEERLADRTFAQERLQSTAPAAPPAARAEVTDAQARSMKSAGAREGVAAQPRLAAAKARADEFTALATRQQPATASEARSLREAWKAWAEAHASDPRADEARVRAVEAGAAAWRLGGDAADRKLLEREARAYLARPDAPQKERVLALLAGLEP